jgi:hypothetical protein
MSDEIRAVFVGNKALKVDDVSEFHTFHITYLNLVCAAYALGGR